MPWVTCGQGIETPLPASGQPVLGGGRGRGGTGRAARGAGRPGGPGRSFVPCPALLEGRAPPPFRWDRPLSSLPPADGGWEERAPGPARAVNVRHACQGVEVSIPRPPPPFPSVFSSAGRASCARPACACVQWRLGTAPLLGGPADGDPRGAGHALRGHQPAGHGRAESQRNTVSA